MRKEYTLETVISNSDLMNEDAKKSLEHSLSSILYDNIGFDAELEVHISCQDIRFMFQSCRRILTIYLPREKTFSIKEICTMAIESFNTNRHLSYSDPDYLRHETNIKK